MSKRTKWQMSVVATLILAAGLIARMALADHGDEGNRPRFFSFIMAFGTMYGVDGPFLDPANAIRGIIGDEAAWKLDSARGFLTKDGHLKIRVRGLIFGDGTPNDEDTFRGAVSCLTENEDLGTTPVANVFTEGFPATPSGDSDIDAQVTLPNPCVAPVIFVLAGSEDKWFSVTGFEAEEGASGGDQHGDDQGEND
jgi:hypothetical protein